jgi:hypothetical protein
MDSSLMAAIDHLTIALSEYQFNISQVHKLTTWRSETITLTTSPSLE